MYNMYLSTYVVLQCIVLHLNHVLWAYKSEPNGHFVLLNYMGLPIWHNTVTVVEHFGFQMKTTEFLGTKKKNKKILLYI